MGDSTGTGLFARLAKTRSSLMHGINSLFQQKDLSLDELLDELEEQLIIADLGTSTAISVIDGLRQRARQQNPESRGELLQWLKQQLLQMLVDIDVTLRLPEGKLAVVLMVGVNGVGKTTTTAKLAATLKAKGKTVMLAACDTFRAAAVEQLRNWGQRLDVPVVYAQHGSDAAAVAHDAWQSARSRQIDVLIVDSAGRQHTNIDLMRQLEKLQRVLQRLDSDAPHEVLLVLDAGTGQNAIVQYEKFNESLGVSGICLSKLDGTAKGGIALAVIDKYRVPIKFLGTGEQLGDLEPFDPGRYIDALLPQDASS